MKLIPNVTLINDEFINKSILLILRNGAAHYVDHVQARQRYKHSVKGDYTFRWKHAIFGQLYSRNPSTDQDQFRTIDYVVEITRGIPGGISPSAAPRRIPPDNTCFPLFVGSREARGRKRGSGTRLHEVPKVVRIGWLGAAPKIGEL